MESQKKLYVGCSLKHAPKDFTDSVESPKDTLRERFEILDFYGSKPGDPRDVYLTDKACVENADYFLAICDLPSLGLGYEIAYALSLNTPTLGVAQSDAEISNMILGIDHPQFSFKRYDGIGDISDILKTYIQKLK